jgi:phosphatidylserine/phosphatidylglycerophosphate/cardiolipin synthase-like enzyme
MKYFISSLSLFFIVGVTSLVYADTKVYFSPNGGCQEAVGSEIGKAQKTIDIAMYSFTSREIAQTLIEAQERHVKIRIVLDKGQKKEAYSKSRYLINKGFNVKYHLGSGLMHNKFAVIDGRVLLTGSFNWTASADKRNEENLLIITDNKAIEKYVKRFEYLWKGSGDEEFKETQMEGKE